MVVPIASPAGACSAQAVFFEVPGKDDVGPVADHQILAHLHAAAGKRIDFGQQAGRIDHHPGGDDALHLGPEDAAGHQGKLEGLAPTDDGMSRVRAALVADHDVVP